MIKKRLAFLLMPILLVCLIIDVSAHSGRTDSKGGHTNHSTGEYHYHHGYSAHDHYDMDGDGIKDCPYDFNDNTDSSTSYRSNDGPRVSEYQQPTRKNNIGSIFYKVFVIAINVIYSILIGASLVYCIDKISPDIFGKYTGVVMLISFVLFSAIAFVIISKYGIH